MAFSFCVWLQRQQYSKHLNCEVDDIQSPLMKMKSYAAECTLTHTALIQMRLLSSNGEPWSGQRGGLTIKTSLLVLAAFVPDRARGAAVGRAEREKIRWQDGQVECEVQPSDAASVLDRSAENDGCAPQQQQQQQHASGQTGVLGEQQHCQAFQSDPRTVEERGGQLVQFLETWWLQEPSSHYGAELQHVWAHLQVPRVKELAYILKTNQDDANRLHCLSRR